MKPKEKKDFPVEEVRRFLEPGPIVLVSSSHRGATDIMTMGWHMVMGFSPSLVGCYIWEANYSYDLILASRECVINVPTTDMAETVVRIGNSSGREMDKFREFGLTAVTGGKVAAPMVGECHASFECVLSNGSLIDSHGLFIFEVVKAHAAPSPEYPETLHYRGDGRFMISGPTVDTWRGLFKPEYL